MDNQNPPHRDTPQRHGPGGKRISPEVTPLYTASVYTFESLQDVRDYYDTPQDAFLYRRNGNPNTHQLEQLLCELEGTEASVLASSGMAAISGAIFALLRPGDRVVATEVLYGGTYAFFEQILRPFGISVEYADINGIEELRSSLSSPVRLVYAETIANPLLQVADLIEIGKLTREVGALFMVDNTFATPALTRPADFGCDVVINSLTKYLNGHSDVIGGVCSGSSELIRQIRQFSETFGSVLSPFDAWMTERGLQTFWLRVRQQCDNAMALAVKLSEHPAVKKVYYPGLPTHPSHVIAKRILKDGFGAMVSFELQGGEHAAELFVQSCRHVDFAPSLGGVKTTLSHPALTSHRALSVEERARLGITSGVIRLSVGVEPLHMIWEDISQSLDATLRED